MSFFVNNKWVLKYKKTCKLYKRRILCRRCFNYPVVFMVFRFVKIGLFLMLFGVLSAAEAANVAVVAPKVGMKAKYGREIAEGARFAIDIVNENGGVNGEKINLIEVDDRCEDSFAVSTAQMIAISSSKNDKIDLVVGHYCNNQFEKVSDIYAKGKVLQIFPMPLNEAEYNVDRKGLFKIGGLVSGQAKAFFKTYEKQYVGNNVAFVYDGSLPMTTETAVETQQLFMTNGMHNLTLFDIGAYDGNYKQMAKEILLNNKVVYVLSNAKNMAKLVQKLQEEDEKVIVFVDEYMANGHFFRELGNFAEGINVLALQDLKDSPEFTEELVKLRLKGKEPKGLGVYGYASVMLWANMAEKAGKTDFDKIVARVKNGSFDMPWGKVVFEKGKISKSGGYKVYQIGEGEYTQVE